MFFKRNLVSRLQNLRHPRNIVLLKSWVFCRSGTDDFFSAFLYNPFHGVFRSVFALCYLWKNLSFHFDFTVSVCLLFIFLIRPLAFFFEKRISFSTTLTMFVLFLKIYLHCFVSAALKLVIQSP